MGEHRPGYWSVLAIFLGAFVVTQVMFLFPRGRLRINMRHVGRPMLLSVLAAAFIAMLLTTGALFTVAQAIIYPFKPDISIWDDIIARGFGDEYWNAFRAVWTIMAIIWSVWAFIFFNYWQTADQYTQLSRMTHGLLRGSILELLVAAPVQAWLHDKDDCYCARGSYTGLVFGATVALWCFGPGIVLLFLREKYRRQKLLDQCDPDAQSEIRNPKSAID